MFLMLGGRLPAGNPFPAVVYVLLVLTTVADDPQFLGTTPEIVHDYFMLLLYIALLTPHEWRKILRDKDSESSKDLLNILQFWRMCAVAELELCY